VIGLEFPYIKLNLEGVFKLQPVKTVNSQMAILLKNRIKDEEK
jgi:hypothetical protein